MSEDKSIVVARPAVVAGLVLLFHGVGATASDLAPLGGLIAKAMPHAMVVSVEAPFASDIGAGRQWFSVRGVTEENRPGRIAQVMPAFQQAVLHWQGEAGVSAEATTLVGFSQGAIMSLESTQCEPVLARRVVSLAGRFAAEVMRPRDATVFHMIHGDSDAVVPAENSKRGAAQLKQLGAQVTLDIVPSLGHGIDMRVVELVTGYLK
ncbi:esterase [Caenimonas koreensis DSM 17982]|uniref:Esterase n=1 Tax=Caenimonas koreensis DSM 17982 TaxID=1121255 RepID=A0A844ARG1_9BURK|nr:esterase [Caenimonas koreensis]MRD46644.1 esterase [Caenimonas koreensis DSM 17982]